MQNRLLHTATSQPPAGVCLRDACHTSTQLSARNRTRAAVPPPLFSGGLRRAEVVCSAEPQSAQPRTGLPGRFIEAKPQDGTDVKEAHKIFDEVFIQVKSGKGGNGEIVESGKGRMVRNFKYTPGGNSPKQMFLPVSEPADGADGADVYLIVDPEYDNLLHLHKRKLYASPDGGGGNPSVGSAGPKRNKLIKKAFTQPVLIPVPPGTVVKRKASGALLGDLKNPGDRLLVAKGGAGGLGAKAPSKESNDRHRKKQVKLAVEAGAELVAVEDWNWKYDTKGQPGQELGLHLLLRVVADVGIVGFPNAGKSSLLKALTRAAPEVADYPFTTLMPNLGVLETGGSGVGPVLADLPGLIEGAHQGRGLGRMFLRHLRRTQLILHVVDAASTDPATDYYAVREELRMYNPDYCARPHVVALNKMDLEDAGDLRDEVIGDVLGAAKRHCEEWKGEEVKPRMPVAVVTCSAMSGDGLADLNRELRKALNIVYTGEAKQRKKALSGEDEMARMERSAPAALLQQQQWLDDAEAEAAAAARAAAEAYIPVGLVAAAASAGGAGAPAGAKGQAVAAEEEEEVVWDDEDWEGEEGGEEEEEEGEAAEFDEEEFARMLEQCGDDDIARLLDSMHVSGDELAALADGGSLGGPVEVAILRTADSASTGGAASSSNSASSGSGGSGSESKTDAAGDRLAVPARRIRQRTLGGPAPTVRPRGAASNSTPGGSASSSTSLGVGGDSSPAGSGPYSPTTDAAVRGAPDSAHVGAGSHGFEDKEGGKMEAAAESDLAEEKQLSGVSKEKLPQLSGVSKEKLPQLSGVSKEKLPQLSGVSKEKLPQLTGNDGEEVEEGEEEVAPGASESDLTEEEKRLLGMSDEELLQLLSEGEQEVVVVEKVEQEEMVEVEEGEEETAAGAAEEDLTAEEKLLLEMTDEELLQLLAEGGEEQEVEEEEEMTVSGSEHEVEEGEEETAAGAAESDLTAEEKLLLGMTDEELLQLLKE